MNNDLLNLDRTPWYLPTMYGDIRLTAQGSQTEVEWENLSPNERIAMDALGKKFSTDTSKDVGKVTIDKSIDKVETLLSKSMKTGRKLLSAVVFKSGRIEEIHRDVSGVYRRPALVEKKGIGVREIVKEVAKAAVTVAEPALSCPVPEFEKAQVRATRVLKEFLTPAQLEDFEKRQQFLVTGADSGHLYLLTSRQAPSHVLDKVGGRSVYDMNRAMAVCVHDWTVPASEELLGLALFLQMPGKERHAAVLPFHPLH